MNRAFARAGSSPLLQPQIELTLGVIHSIRGHYEESIAHYQNAIRRRRRLEGPDTLRVLIMLNNLGAAYDNIGRTQDALVMLRETVALSERVKGKTRGGLRLTWLNLGMISASLGQYDEARNALEECLVDPENTYSAEARAVLSDVDMPRGQGERSRRRSRPRGSAAREAQGDGDERSHRDAQPRGVGLRARRSAREGQGVREKSDRRRDAAGRPCSLRRAPCGRRRATRRSPSSSSSVR